MFNAHRSAASDFDLDDMIAEIRIDHADLMFSFRQNQAFQWRAHALRYAVHQDVTPWLDLELNGSGRPDGVAGLPVGCLRRSGRTLAYAG